MIKTLATYLFLAFTFSTAALAQLPSNLTLVQPIQVVDGEMSMSGEWGEVTFEFAEYSIQMIWFIFELTGKKVRDDTILMTWASFPDPDNVG